MDIPRIKRLDVVMCDILFLLMVSVKELLRCKKELGMRFGKRELNIVMVKLRPLGWWEGLGI